MGRNFFAIEERKKKKKKILLLAACNLCTRLYSPRQPYYIKPEEYSFSLHLQLLCKKMVGGVDHLCSFGHRLAYVV